MSQGQLPGGARVMRAANSHQLPSGVYVLDGVTPLRVRALILVNGQISQVVDGLLGTNRRPLVLYQGQYQERVANEGVPVVLDSGVYRTLKANETLMI